MEIVILKAPATQIQYKKLEIRLLATCIKKIIHITCYFPDFT